MAPFGPLGNKINLHKQKRNAPAAPTQRRGGSLQPRAQRGAGPPASAPGRVGSPIDIKKGATGGRVTRIRRSNPGDSGY